jgi:hypothetical protein
VSTERTPGEAMFEAYLVEHGHAVPEHEPNLGVSKRPDYVIQRDEQRCVCEVKEFAADTSSLPVMTGFVTTGVDVILKPIRSQIRQAARQLKPLAASGLPLVVVITNPHRAMVITGDQEVIWAMYGDPVFRFTVNTTTGAGEDDGLFTVDRNGKLRGDHQYISALAFIRHREHAADFYNALSASNEHLSPDERLAAINDAADSGQVPQGTYLSMDVFRTMSPTAVPLPDVFFDGPRDRVFDHDPAAEVYRQVRGPVR